MILSTRITNKLALANSDTTTFPHWIKSDDLLFEVRGNIWAIRQLMLAAAHDANLILKAKAAIPTANKLNRLLNVMNTTKISSQHLSGNQLALFIYQSGKHHRSKNYYKQVISAMKKQRSDILTLLSLLNSIQ